MTEEIQKKIEEAPTLLDKVRVLLNEANEPEVMYNKLNDPEETIEDIALIQCFYGTDIARIRATTQALEFNLQMTAKPSTWVFVECQRKKSECAFQWLKGYGVKYVFVQMKPENEGIMLKHPLWNIGVANCTESRLCFVDSDVVMCNSDWVKKASVVFDSSCDVLSLASHQYYQADEKCAIHESIGYKWVSNFKADKGHVGFTLGLTRKTFNLIGRLEPAIILDDIHAYHRILGDREFKSFEQWYKPFDLPSDRKSGFNVELGYADNIACHIWHGDAPSKYDDLTKLMVASGVKSMSDIFAYPKGDELPTWKTSTTKGLALRNTILRYYEHVKKYDLETDKPEFDIVGEYRSEMKRLLGEPDEKHPLFVCTVVKDRFGLKLDDFTKFRDMVENKFLGAKVQPVVLFFTDCRKYDFKSDEFNVVPIKNYNPEDEFAQCMRKDLKWPKNVIIYYVPFDLTDFRSDIWIPDERIDTEDGTVIFSR